MQTRTGIFIEPLQNECHAYESKLASKADQPCLLRRPRAPRVVAVTTKTKSNAIDKTLTDITDHDKKKNNNNLLQNQQSSKLYHQSLSPTVVNSDVKTIVSANKDRDAGGKDQHVQKERTLLREYVKQVPLENTIQQQTLQRDSAYASRMDSYVQDRVQLQQNVNSKAFLNHDDDNNKATVQFSRCLTACSVFNKAHNNSMRRDSDVSFTEFISDLSEAENLPISTVNKIMLSRHNYIKIQKLLCEQYSTTAQDDLHIIDLKLPNQFNIQQRVPFRQLLIELSSFLRERVGEITEQRTCTARTSAAQSKQKVHFANGFHNISPETEVDASEMEDAGLSQSRLSRFRDAQASGKESVLSASRTRFFQGAQRSSSPFQHADVDTILPAEIAVLDSLMQGATVLNLKAHFLHELPDMTMLLRTLLYFNLSYNNFSELPLELYKMSNLIILKLRNNPIRSISPRISGLQNLQSLVVSYCLIENLPAELFQLKHLQFLDLAYNKLTSLPNELSQLCELRDLTVEGNQLPGLPSGVLRLKKLQYICITNNFMHPVFWVENCRNQPQSLRDMAFLAVWNCKPNATSQSLSDTMEKAKKTCDCCGGARFGRGFRTLRPVKRLCGVKNVPIIFQSCSAQCLATFRHKVHDLDEIIYGVVDSLGHTQLDQ